MLGRLTVSLVLATGVMLATGVARLPDIGYSTALPHRLQVEALLQGHLAISTNLDAVDFDHTFSNGGVQQVWGLGIPIWRIIFEFPWKALLGHSAPDRLALLVAEAILIYFGLGVFIGKDDSDAAKTGEGELLLSYVSGLVLTMSPFFINLLQSRMMVYEEALAYTFIFATLQYVLLCKLKSLNSKKAIAFLLPIICFAAGFGPLVRPTLVFYGFATLLVGLYIGRPHLSIKRLVFCLVIFLAPLAILAWTNRVRFGSSFEFGHFINLTTRSVAYVTRLNDPFASASLRERIFEVFGSLFFVNQFNGCEYFKNSFFLGESDHLRWREFNFTTYPVGILLLLIGYFVAGTTLLVKMLKSSDRFSILRMDELHTLTFAWITMSFFGLTCLYCYAPVISSRYMYDFAAVLTVSSVMAVRILFRNNLLSLLAMLLVMGYSLASFKTTVPVPGVAKLEDITQYVNEWKSRRWDCDIIPGRYFVGMTNLPTIIGACEGWDSKTGTTDMSCFFYVQSCTNMVLEIRPPLSTVSVQASVSALGKRWHTIKTNYTESSILLEFEKPGTVALPLGVFPVFISLANPNDLLNTNANGRLIQLFSN